ncbi:unnamed protein product [Closterium sp. Naga37s-1]|nr:unnamed protein product [Closterium sp. Naga37s-1]
MSMTGSLEEAGGRGKGRSGRPRGGEEGETRGEGEGGGRGKGKQLSVLVEKVGGGGLEEGGEEGRGADGKAYPVLDFHHTIGETSVLRGSNGSDSNGSDFSSSDTVGEAVVVRRTRGRRKSAKLTEKKEDVEKGGERFVVEVSEEGRGADGRVGTESLDSVLHSIGYEAIRGDSTENDSTKSDSNGSEAVGDVVVVRRTRGRRKSVAGLTQKKEDVEGEEGGDAKGKTFETSQKSELAQRIEDVEGEEGGDRKGKKKGMGRRKAKDASVNDTEEKGNFRADDDMRMGVRSENAAAICADVGDPVCGDVAINPPEDGDGNSLLKYLQNLALEAMGSSDTEGEKGLHVPAPTALDPMESRKRAWHADITQRHPQGAVILGVDPDVLGSNPDVPAPTALDPMESRKRAWHADITQRHPQGAVILGVDPDVLGALAVLFVKPRRKQEAESCAVSVVNTGSGREEEQGDGAEKALRVQSCSEAIFEAPQKALRVQSCSEAAQHAATSEWEERLTVAAAEASFRLPSHPLTLFSFPSLPPALLLPAPPPSCSSADPFSPHLLLPFSASLPLSTPITASVRLAYVEQARPFPSDGKLGWYGCGFGFGVWMGVLAASGFDVTAVTSVRWKAAIRSQAQLAFTSKEDSRQLALSLFRSLAAQLKRKKDHGRAEALLIATYGTNLWPPSGEKAKKTRSRAKAATGEAVRTDEGMEDGSSRMEAKEDLVPITMPSLVK